eukprot:scaffold34563_cov30-Tisochrysis_lutea.AAC.2
MTKSKSQGNPKEMESTERGGNQEREPLLGKPKGGSPPNYKIPRHPRPSLAACNHTSTPLITCLAPLHQHLTSRCADTREAFWQKRQDSAVVHGEENPCFTPRHCYLGAIASRLA